MASSDSSFVEGPRHAVITSDDVGPIITIIALFLMVSMVLAVLLRLAIRFSATSVPGIDDAVVSVALLGAIGEVIVTAVTVNNGLGTRPSLLSSEQIEEVERAVYATQLLYILTISLGKASTLLLLHRLTIAQHHQIAKVILAGLILAWSLTTLFGAGFQCDLPKPWVVEKSRCIDIASFWNAVGSIDILIDVALVGMIVWIVSELQMPLERKIVVVASFMFRLCLPAAQIARLVYIGRFSSDGRNPYIGLGYQIATQCHTTLAVIVACIPAYKAFMDRISSGLMGVSLRERTGTYQLSSLRNSSRSRSKPSAKEISNPIPDSDFRADIRANSARNGNTLEEPGAYKTVEWRVSYSDEARLNDAINSYPTGAAGEREGQERAHSAASGQSHDSLP